MDKQDAHPIHTVELGKRLKAARSEKGYSIGSFAAKVHLSDRYITGIERGEKIPKMETFVRLLNVLELSADEALQDSLVVQYKMKASELEKKISELTPQQRKLVLDVLDAMLQNMQG